MRCLFRLNPATTGDELTLLIGVFVAFSFQFEPKNFVVTLDAGHGGHDYGALGEKTNEKTLTLSVVTDLGKLIEKNLADVDVVYTRDRDIFIPLNERASIANNAKSDLFISVHINSVDKRNRNRKQIEGCQVYTLGLHKTYGAEHRVCRCGAQRIVDHCRTNAKGGASGRFLGAVGNFYAVGAC